MLHGGTGKSCDTCGTRAIKEGWEGVMIAFFRQT